MFYEYFIKFLNLGLEGDKTAFAIASDILSLEVQNYGLSHEKSLAHYASIEASGIREMDDFERNYFDEAMARFLATTKKCAMTVTVDPEGSMIQMPYFFNPKSRTLKDSTSIDPYHAWALAKR